MIGTAAGRKIAIVFVAFAAVVVAIVILSWVMRQGPAEVQKVAEETRAVTVFFGDKDAEGFVPETREVPAVQTFEAQVKLVIGELVKGPRDAGRFSAIPEGTVLVQAFWIEDTQTLVLDFNGAMTANHPGGSTGEYYTIANVVKTVEANFPQVAYVQFLVDGAAVESIAGHYAVDTPIDVKKWR